MGQSKVLNCCALLALVSTVMAADCSQPRKDGDPSGNDISTALTSHNQLSGVCSGNFPPGNDKTNTYNYWFDARSCACNAKQETTNMRAGLWTTPSRGLTPANLCRIVKMPLTTSSPSASQAATSGEVLGLRMASPIQ